MEKTLKRALKASLTAGALALSVGCIAIPVEPVQPMPAYPIRTIIYEPIYPWIITTYPRYEHHEWRHENYHSEGPFKNPTGNHERR